MGQNSVTGVPHQRGDRGRIRYDRDCFFFKYFIYYSICSGDVRVKSCANHYVEVQRTTFRGQFSPLSMHSTHVIRHV